MKKNIRGMLFLAILLITLVQNSQARFYIQNGKVYDGKHNNFVMRGVNIPHAWYADKTDQVINDIAKTGANCVRIVLSNGKQYTRTSGANVSEIIENCKKNKLIAILEVHDATGYGDKIEAANPTTCVDYWLSPDIKDAILGQEDYVIINIANEPFGNNQPASVWTDFHKNAINRMRNAGIEHLLMVDAANWGQDWEEIMKKNARSVINSDPLYNVVFSVHMYDVYNTSDKITNYLSEFIYNAIPLVVGEFASDHGPGKNVDEYTIMSECEKHNLGYIGWSWSGNRSDLASLDIVNNFNANVYTPWGNTLINGTYGINKTSEICTIFNPTRSEEVSFTSEIDNIEKQESYTFRVNYTAAGPREIHVDFFNNNWDYLGGGYTIVAAGSGSANVSVKLNNGVPSAGTGYKLKCDLRPEGLSWQYALSQEIVENITVKPDVVSLFVQAEAYNWMGGVKTQYCSEGGLNVGWIDAGDWMTYDLTIPVKGTYTVEYRVASLYGGGSICLEKAGGSIKYGTVSVPKTNNWQNWTTISHTVSLEQGKQLIAIGVPKGGYNINWFKFTLNNQKSADLVIANAESEIEKSVHIYPNPINSNGYLNVKVENNESTLSIFDLSGKQILFSKLENNLVNQVHLKKLHAWQYGRYC
jgi:mannan endo-1,4-beta-mannosidase